MKKLCIFIALIAIAPFSLNAVASESILEPVTKTLVWPEGTRYVGGVAAGKRTGKGTIFWQDGTRFVGQFENDMRNGPGTMILPDGTVYTGLFRNDELVDTEATIAASNAQDTMALNEQESVAALEDTEMPMEADSISSDGFSEEPVAEEEAVTYDEPEIADELFDDQLVEQEALDVPEEEYVEDEPIEQIPAKQETAAVDDNYSSAAEDDYQSDEYTLDDPYATGDVTGITDTVKDELTETIDLWMAAWSDQNVTQYLANYSDDFAVPDQQSRRTWEAFRRSRIARPRYINIDVDYQRFEFVENNVIDVFFRQSYRSNSYSDLTDKVLRMGKDDTDWKILIERSR